MANDVELSVGADVGQAKASVDDLRKVFTEFFSGFGIGEAKAKAFAEAYAVEFARVGASTDDAKAKMEELRPEIERLAAEFKRTGEGAAAAFAHAQEAVERFGEEAATGGTKATRAAVDAKLAIVDLEDEIQKLREKGEPTAELEAGLESLKRKTHEATDELGRYRAAQRDVADESKAATARAGELQGQIGGLRDVFGSLSPAAAKAIGNIAISKIVFDQAYDGTRKLIGTFKEFGIDLDAVAVDFFNLRRAAEEYVNAETKVQTSERESIESALELRNAQNILAKQFNDTASSIDEARRKLAEHTRAQYEDAIAAKDAGEALFGKSAGLEIETRALLSAIEAKRKDGALNEEQTEAVKAALQEKLDAYRLAGKEIDENLAREAAALGVVTTAQEKAAEEAEQSAERVVTAAGSRATAEEEATARQLAAIESRRAAVLAADQEIADSQKRLDAALAKGAPIDNSGVPSGDGSAPAKGAKDSTAELAKVKDQIAQIEGAPLISPEQMNQLDTLKGKARELSGELQSANQVFTVTGDNFLTEAEAADAASAAYDVYIGRLGKAAAEQNLLLDSQEKNEVTASKLADANERLSQLVGRAGGGFTDLGESASGAADSVDQAAGAVDGLVDSASAVQGAASDAAGAMGELADATAEVGKGDGSGGPLDGLAGGLDKAKTGIADAGEALKGFNADLLTSEEIIDRIATKLANLQLGASE